MRAFFSSEGRMSEPRNYWEELVKKFNDQVKELEQENARLREALNNCSYQFSDDLDLSKVDYRHYVEIIKQITLNSRKALERGE